MTGARLEFNPVTHITTGYIGQPGKRVFYLQAHNGPEVLTLIVEKQQIEMLASAIEQFLAELQEKVPDLPEASDAYKSEEMALETPVDPAFRVGQIGLGYDQERDLLVLVAQEVLAEERDPEEAATARLFATRSQMRALGQYGLTLIKQGRPICGHCGQPIDPEGHFCPKRNGHKY